ncbi:hypothetical protein LY76DRAFT_599147 [Colletotrichum caudatum]|nr:hypothetical protein LY76DRAFT_599147 [Colletotrichum caudatum]
MLAFLDPESKEGLLPRTLRKAHATVDQILPRADTLKDEIDRLIISTDRRGARCRTGCRRPSRRISTSRRPFGRAVASSSSAAPAPSTTKASSPSTGPTPPSKATRLCSPSTLPECLLAQLTQKADDTIKALEKQVAGAAARFHDANKALDDMSGALRALLDTRV